MHAFYIAAIAASLLSFVFASSAEASTYRILFERDADGNAGNELAVVSYPTLDAIVDNTTSVTQFSQVDIDPNYSISAAVLNGAYQLFFERNVDGTAGNDLAVVSFPTFDDLIDNTTSITQFSQIDIDPAFSIVGAIFDGAYRLLFERDADGIAGSELAVVSFPTFDDLINNTTSTTQFSQIDIDPAFSVAGFIYDDEYRLLFERDADGIAGNELALVSYPTLDDLVNNTISVTQFSQIDIDPAFSVAGFIYEPDEPMTGGEVPLPGAAIVFLTGLAGLRFARRRPAANARLEQILAVDSRAFLKAQQSLRKGVAVP